MPEPREKNAQHSRMEARRQAGAARDIRSNRQELSNGRGHIYLQGTYAPETRPPRRGPLTPAEVEQIRQLRTGGMSILDISCQLDRSMGTIQNACAAHGILSPRQLQEGYTWDIPKKEKDLDTGNPPDAGNGTLLDAHNAGVCGRGCRLGRHGRRSLEELQADRRGRVRPADPGIGDHRGGEVPRRTGRS